jgi:FMN phosphatase YigB (HAD superfamily)
MPSDTIHDIYGFDFDGTLVETWTATPLPGVREALQSLPAGARTFIATNQAGPVYRAMLGDAKYPTVADVVGRLQAGLAALDWCPDYLLVAIHPGRYGDDWERARVPIYEELVRALDALPCRCVASGMDRWRKPEPGMLQLAQTLLGGGELVYVGDMETDRRAAEAAGARYLNAVRWRAGNG